MTDQAPEAPSIDGLASVHTESLTSLLRSAGVSLAITTYQAGKLILARADGEVTNTHFRAFQKPMGLASDGRRLALGTANRIVQFHNVPDSAPALDPDGRHDACYVQRSSAVTGNVDTHEMAWAEDGLWFVNTRFSCLCTIDSEYSFVPRWRPPFITAYDLRDRCHLNGLGLRDGRPRYVTALGSTDTPNGWREHKADGGIVMDITDDRIVSRGLSMPHSPRWYRNQLWVLESGRGALLQVDPDSGARTTIAELPGFTRGLDFLGDYAFIGLSQVRESAVFAGLPITRTQPIRHSGVWVVDIRDGNSVAFLRFEAGVQEIFSVVLLPHRFPDVLEETHVLTGSTYVLPDAALQEAVQPQANWEFAEMHFEQGNKSFNEGKLEDAITCFRRCLGLARDNATARFNMGIALGKLGRIQEAEQALTEVLGADAGHIESMLGLGLLLHQQGRYPEAARRFEQVLDLRPGDLRAREGLQMVSRLSSSPTSQGSANPVARPTLAAGQ